MRGGTLTDWFALALLLGVIGSAVDSPAIIFVAFVTLANALLARGWTRYGTHDVEYGRTLSTTQAVAGDDVGLDVTIWNRKALPLPWISADDKVTAGLRVRESPRLMTAHEEPMRRLLHNSWALAWYERVVRHFHLEGVARGAYEFGPVHLRVRDVLGRDVATRTEELRDTLVVGPRTAQVRGRRAQTAPIGERRARQSLYRDPTLFGGVRPFQPGDSLRRIHWRATARLGAAMSRRFEPARGREVVLAIDVQQVEGELFELSWDEDELEAMCSITASIARRLLAEGASVGITAASFAGGGQRQAWLAPQASRGQLARAEALLARVGPIPSGPFGGLLTWLTHRLPPGATVMVLTARDPRVHLPALRRLRRSGYSIELVALGSEGSAHAGIARRAGIPATAAEVIVDGERTEAVVLAG